jgi:O-acetyl-ADP-ribose deacetylase (regulator of RNase III)
MIEIRQGDILQADAEALVNTVNCVGIMGRGIALQFRKAFPENYRVYKTACDRKELHPGIMLVYDLNRLQNPRYVINFPTKRHWKGKSRIEDINTGLEALVAEIRKRNIRSIAVPPLGCGLGGLQWKAVRPVIEQAFQSLPDLRVLLYEPTGAPAPQKMVKEKRVPNMTPGRAALLGLMRRYLAAVMDPSISLLEIHKLMYFMQEAGEALKLNYRKATFGPYSENLRHVLSKIEGYFIQGFGDAEDRPEKQIELMPDASEWAEEFLQDHPETQTRCDRVSDLIAGFETPFGMELLASVHWVASREGAKTEAEVVQKLYEWNERKRMFKERHARIACEILRDKGWLAKPESGLS